MAPSQGDKDFLEKVKYFLSEMQVVENGYLIL